MKYRFFVRWEDCAEFDVDAENEAEAFAKIGAVAERYEYGKGGLEPYRDRATAQIIECDGQSYEGAEEEIKRVFTTETKRPSKSRLRRRVVCRTTRRIRGSVEKVALRVVALDTPSRT